MQIKPLLARDGTVWVHLDDAEVHRCRLVMDEVFGTERYIGSVTWEKVYARKSNNVGFSPNHDTILVYGASDTYLWNRLAPTVELLSRYKNYDDDPRGPWQSVSFHVRTDRPEKRVDYRYEIELPSGRSVLPPNGRHWNGKRARFDALVGEDLIWFGKDGDSLPRFKHFVELETIGLAPFTIWPRTEVGDNDEAKGEIRDLFPGLSDVFDTPKPERLLQRIIHIATDPGDIVLDCFGGSGTTAAVAHKMGRRWVTSEREPETVSTFTLPRLTKVVNNDDPGGITSVETPTGDGLPDGVKGGEAKSAARVLGAFLKADALGEVEGVDQKTVKAIVKAMRDADKTTKETLWSGGGGFRVLDVGPSMFEEVEGRVYLAEWATNGKLAEAIGAQYGYAYEPDGPFSGTKGQMRLVVIDGLVNEAVVRLLADALPEGQRMAVCGTAVDPDARAVLRELRPGSTLKKVPASLLDEYRSSRRDRLRMANVLDRAEAVEATNDGESV